MDDAWMGAMTDRTDKVLTDSEFYLDLVQEKFNAFSPHDYQGILTGFQLMVTE